VKRRTLPIVLGKKRAALVFSLFTLLTYVWIAWAAAAGRMPVFALLAFLTLPIALQAIRGAYRYDDMEAFLPAMMKNVLLVLSTQALLAVGYILGGIFPGQR